MNGSPHAFRGCRHGLSRAPQSGRPNAAADARETTAPRAAVAALKRLRRVRPRTAVPETPPALRHRIAVEPGAERCSIVIAMEPAGQARRYVFEVNAADRHVARLGFRDILGRGGLLLGTEIALPMTVGSDELWIEARQSGILPAHYSSEQAAKFAPHPFRILVQPMAPRDPPQGSGEVSSSRPS